MSFPDPQDLARQIIASAIEDAAADYQGIGERIADKVPADDIDAWTETVSDLLDTATVVVHWSEVSDR